MSEAGEMARDESADPANADDPIYVETMALLAELDQLIGDPEAVEDCRGIVDRLIALDTERQRRWLQDVQSSITRRKLGRDQG